MRRFLCLQVYNKRYLKYTNTCLACEHVRTRTREGRCGSDLAGAVFRAADAKPTGSIKEWKRESKTKGGKKTKKQGARREKQSAKRS